MLCAVRFRCGAISREGTSCAACKEDQRHESELERELNSHLAKERHRGGSSLWAD